VPVVVPIKPRGQQTEPYDGQILALSMIGKFGHGHGFGFIAFGKCRMGDKRPGQGIYRRKKLGFNQFTGPPASNAGHELLIVRHYAPTNPQTEPQQANRAKMTLGVAAWQGLTTLEKQVYNRRGSKVKLNGYNLFLREYLYSH